MKFKSTIFAQTSGSLAGKTFSHNKGGMYVRARATPINPNTPFQQAVRTALKTLTTRWGNVLTTVQRASWQLYATNVPLINKLGEPHAIPALAMYLRCNSARLITLGPSTIIDDGPAIFSLATMTTPIVEIIAGTTTIAFTNTDDWATATGGTLLVYQSRPQNPSINFFKGPFRSFFNINGNTMTPPTSPQTVGPGLFPVTPGQKLFYRFRASNADGRLSSDVILSTIAT